MSLLVQKFGGTSIADIDRVRKAAEIVVTAASEGHQVATVVSAMGHTTDELIALSEKVTDRPDPREMDMLMATGEQVSIALMTMAIQSLGYKARSFTGAQAGIITDSRHGLARIIEVKADAVKECLDRGEIAVVAGFQGLSPDNELTTLGRGGSDTTAVALAGALMADRCDIFTDVDGVYTADPRMLSSARRLHSVSYEEMLELSATGAQVLAARSVELAMERKVPLRVRPTFKPQDLGTLIAQGTGLPQYSICGISCDMNQVAFTLRSERMRSFLTYAKFDSSGSTMSNMDGLTSLFNKLQDMNITADMLMLLAHEDEPAQEVAFTVERRHQSKVSKVIESFRGLLADPKVTVSSDIARISVVGGSLNSKPEIVASLFEALRTGGIPISQVATGDIRVSIIIPARFAQDAVKLIHDKFGLGLETVVA